MGKEDRHLNGATVADLLRANLKDSGYTPPRLDGKFHGWPAVFRTNESSSEEFKQELKDLKPNGYIVGVGAGSIFSLLSVFDDATSLPKGLVVLDRSPAVVTALRLLVSSLESCDDVNALIENFFKLSREDYLRKIAEELVEATDAELFADWNSISAETFLPIDAWKLHGRRLSKSVPPKVIDPVDEVLANFQALKSLTSIGSLAVAYGDITNPRVGGAVKSLPDFTKSTNVIYTSNLSSFTSVDELIHQFSIDNQPQILVESTGAPLSLRLQSLPIAA